MFVSFLFPLEEFKVLIPISICILYICIYIMCVCEREAGYIYSCECVCRGQRYQVYLSIAFLLFILYSFNYLPLSIYKHIYIHYSLMLIPPLPTVTSCCLFFGFPTLSEYCSNAHASVPEAWPPMATPTMDLDFFENGFLFVCLFPNLALTDLSVVAGHLTVNACVTALAVGLQVCVHSCLHSKQLLASKDLSILLS